MIKIKILDKELSMEEAKELYLELHQLFGNSTWKINRMDLYNPSEKKPGIICDGKEPVKYKENNRYKPLCENYTRSV